MRADVPGARVRHQLGHVLPRRQGAARRPPASPPSLRGAFSAFLVSFGFDGDGGTIWNIFSGFRCVVRIVSVRRAVSGEESWRKDSRGFV